MRKLVLFSAALATIAAPASAASPRPWFALAVGGSTYAMSDVNRDIANLNTMIGPGGPHMNEITSGISLGFSAGFDLESGPGFGVGYERVTGKSEASDASGGIEYALPANLIKVFGEYAFVRASKTRACLGVAVGQVSEAGTVTLSITGSGYDSADLKGTGALFEGYANGEIWTAPQFALLGATGYRHARANEITVRGNKAYNSDGSRYGIDYSGLFLRVGFKVALTR